MLCGISPIYIEKTIIYNGSRNTKIITQRINKSNEYKSSNGDKPKTRGNSSYTSKSFGEVLKEKITKVDGR
jgi:flagellar hook-basal body complex protein FliE